MSESTRTQSGHGHGAKHSPLYQGVMVVECDRCPNVHKMIVASDERAMVEVQIDNLVVGLRAHGYRVAAALFESHHPGTDLSIRDWQEVERLLDDLSYQELPF